MAKTTEKKNKVDGSSNELTPVIESMKSTSQIEHSKKVQQGVVKEYTHDEILTLSNIYFKSGLAPSHLKNPESIYISFRWAISLNIDPFLGMRDIFVIDNIPTLRTEAAIALVEASGFCENIEQYWEGEKGTDSYTAVCKVKAYGRKEHISRFSVADAKLAKLWEKKHTTSKGIVDSSWVTYRWRMMMYRAVGFALRDVFPHVLRGCKLKEEVETYDQYKDVTEMSNGEIKVVKNNNSKSGSTRMRDNMNQMPPEDETDYEEVK
jgi:hypothetical protein